MTVGIRRLPCVLVATLVVLGRGPTDGAADVVTTTDGKSYEGKVVNDDAAHVVIDTTFDGTKDLPRSLVKAVDKGVPPLREQFAFRLGDAKDVASLTALVDWAKAKGFKDDLADVWRKVLTLDPAHAKAHKALGHVLVGKVWMTPEEKAAADAAALEAGFRAKGLVPHGGRWVTPAEKAALEKGLVKDGDEWVTEDELHRRRGETKVGDAWVRVGEAEGKARGAAISKELGQTMRVAWAPHVDLVDDLDAAGEKAVLDATEKATAAFYRLMSPGPGDKLDGARIDLQCFQKAPTYARYCEWFAKVADLATLAGFEGWGRQAGRLRGCHWWPTPGPMVATYVFPFTVANASSFAAHHALISLVSRYRFSIERPIPPWFVEGLAYALEVEATGTTETFTVGRGGIAGGGDPGPWQEVAKWKDALKAAVASTQDTPFARLSTFAEEQVQLPDLVKSWSLVAYLLGLDRAKMKPLVDGLLARGKTQDDALRAAYGVDGRELEARWRTWVGGGFKGP